jgi:hypothetical protein
MRFCPKCSCVIKHTTKWSRDKHNAKNSLCRKCYRLYRVEYLQSIPGWFGPGYNRQACEYFDELNKERGWNGQHALNGGEFLVKDLGYWVDYYESRKNIVIEWDEPSHYRRGILHKEDVLRMNAIKQHLKCKFFRYNQKTNELKEW